MEKISVSDLTNDRKLGNLLETVVREVKSYAEAQLTQIKKLTDIGIALSAEKSINRLLEKIVDEARHIASADAGTLYILDNESQSLQFEILQNDTMNIRKGGAKGDTVADDMPNVPLYDSDDNPNYTNVSSYVALTGQQVNVPDVYQASEFDFTGPKKYDESTGYRSQSMLVLPLRNHEEKIIGVLQLLNATDPETGDIIPFLPENVDMVASLASQAAVALTNAQLIEDLKNLFDAFIKSIATAIDEKSPFTGGHINRVVKLTMDIAEEVNNTDSGYFRDKNFSEDELEELRIAAWMHDVGKITTPEYIVNKINKLDGIFDRIQHIETRFALIQETLKNEYLEKKIAILQNEPEKDRRKMLEKLDKQLQQKTGALSETLALIQSVNNGEQRVTEEVEQKIQETAELTYQVNGQRFPYLTADEVRCLTIRAGNLLKEERRAIEHHAEMTQRITSELPFPERLSRVPEYAGGHHEKLDGSGYPGGLKDGEIPLQTRIIAIADVFEALTAKDRPYKDPMKISKALSILQDMKEKGHIDPHIVDLFVKRELYRRYGEEELAPEQMD